MSEKIPDAVRQYMSEIGSKKTRAKSKASRENAVKAAAARRRNPLDLPCTCDGGEVLKVSAHKTTCPRGRLLYQRERTAQRKAAQAKEAKRAAQSTLKDGEK
jgi:hypothetical protein